MPLFEYRCSACGHLEEVLQKHDEPAPEACEKCHARATLEKEVSRTSFQLKGGGWYKDLYASTPASSSSTTPAASTTAPAAAPAAPAASAPAAAPAAPSSSSGGGGSGGSGGSSGPAASAS